MYCILVMYLTMGCGVSNDLKILICNAGSTSLKFKLWEMPELTVLADGKVERVGSKDAIFRRNL